MRGRRILLDANVLVDALLCDTFLRLGEAEIVEIMWSEPILAETRKALADSIGLTPEQADRRIAAMNRAFPFAAIEGFEHRVEELVLPDANDRHVLAAALEAECDILVTNNVRDFPDETVGDLDLVVLSADDAIVLIATENSGSVAGVIRRQVIALSRPPMELEQFLDRMSNRAPQASVAIGASLGIETYERMLLDVMDVQRDDSPQGAVRGLLDALAKPDLDLALDLLTHDFVSSLGGPDEARAWLTERLGDAIDSEGWGFSTAKRITGPNTEYVKLIRAGNEPLIAWEPQLVVGHLFELEFANDQWRIAGVDGPDPATEPR